MQNLFVIGGADFKLEQSKFHRIFNSIEIPLLGRAPELEITWYIPHFSLRVVMMSSLETIRLNDLICYDMTSLAKANAEGTRPPFKPTYVKFNRMVMFPKIFELL